MPAACECGRKLPPAPYATAVCECGRTHEGDNLPTTPGNLKALAASVVHQVARATGGRLGVVVLVAPFHADATGNPYGFATNVSDEHVARELRALADELAPPTNAPGGAS